MAKLSEQKKVELLENAVLNGTVEETARIMEEHTPFEFTARALGYAARFRGVEMVKCLIEHGATFAYEAVPAFVKKYATKVAISNIYSYNVDYSLFLLKDQKINPISDSVQILDDTERTLINMRYYQDKTQTEVAKHLGISQVQVSRMEKKILLRMRKNMEG